MPQPSTTRTATLIASVALSALAMAACTQAPATSDQSSADVTSTQDESANDATAYPLTVDNCGTEVTFTQAPQQVVTIKSTSTELLLALGLEDRIVGQAFPDGPVPPEWAPSQELTTISERVPGQEAVLELEPDLVLAGWESNLTADGAGERDLLASLGVNTYVAPSACQDPAYQPNPMTFDELFSHFEEAGEIFDVSPAADALVEEQQTQLAALEPVPDGLTALWWSSGTDTPFVGGGIGAPQMVMEAAGLENIAGDLDQTWSSLSWEAIIDADPDVLVLIDAEWNTAESKIASLEAHPARSQMSAVQGQRYVVIPFPAGEAGVRSVSAALEMAEQVRALDLGAAR